MENSFIPKNKSEHLFSIDSLPTIEDAKKRKQKILYFGLGAVLVLILYCFVLSAPADFPVGATVKINPGESLRKVSLKLKEDKIIRSRLALEAFVVLYGAELKLMSSDYFFEDKVSVFEVARRIAKGETHMAPIEVTIPEGFSVKEMAEVFDLNLPNFNKENFLLKTSSLEGYLFPDTYFFLNTDGESAVIKSMSENFKKKLIPLEPEISAVSKTEKEIIIMASLIEGEARGEGDRGVISGILWKRISLGMPLQVDVDLSTYKNKGLPVKPVGNPGLRAIEAAIHPEKTNYLYYLHDKDGNIHYARTFTEHRQNISRYLKQ